MPIKFRQWYTVLLGVFKKVYNSVKRGRKKKGRVGGNEKKGEKIKEKVI